MMRTFRVALFAALVTVFLNGCGSGGSSGSNNDPGHGLTPGSGTSTATATIGAQGTSLATVIYAVEFTLTLPATVTITADAASGEVQAGVVKAADTRALVGARYNPATATAPPSLKVSISDPLGFALGDLAAITLLYPSGTALTAGEISLADFSARDANGVTLPGITPNLVLRTQ